MLHIFKTNIPRVILKYMLPILVHRNSLVGYKSHLTLLDSVTRDTWGQGSAFVSIDSYNYFQGNIEDRRHTLF